MDTRDRHILSVTCYGHFLSHFNMLVFPAILLPLSRGLGMGMTDTLDLAFWMYLLFGLTALPWGILADRFGPRPLLALFYLGAGCSGLAAAMAMGSPRALELALAGVGLFSGIYHPAGLGWIACCVSRTSAGMAVNGMFGNLGLAMGPLLAGLVNWFWGARGVYLGLAAMNLTGLVLLWRSGGDTCAVAVHSTRQGAAAASWRRFAVLLVVMMLGGVVYRGATVILPSLFELRGVRIDHLVTGLLSERIPGNVTATVLVSCLYLVGMLGQYAGGRVGERFDLRLGYLTFHLLTIPVAFAMALVSDLPLVLLATLHSFFLLGMQPIENTLVARLTPPTVRSMAFGMKFVLTFGVGSLAVKLVRFVESARGIDAVFPALGLVSVLLVCWILVLIRVSPPLRS